MSQYCDTINDIWLPQYFKSPCDWRIGDMVFTQIDESSFENISVLGTGGYGRVVLVRKKDGTDDGQLYAMKILTKEAILHKAKMVEHVLTERKVLEAVGKSKFLVKLHYAFQSANKLHLVMDYVCGGELFTHLQQRLRFNENVVQFYMAEMILALSHLHGLKIIYRDLKLENVMLDSRGHVVLTDFGLSKIFPPNEKMFNTFSFCGTIEYMAPEIINVPPNGYSFAVDWWSLGVLSYELVSGRSPFAFFDSSNSHVDIADRVVNGQLPSFNGISDDLTDVLSRLMEKDPKRRLGYNGHQQICEHVFFKSIDWNKMYNQEVSAPIVPTVENEVDTRNFLREFTKQPITDFTTCSTTCNWQVFLDFDFDQSIPHGRSALFTSFRPRVNQMRSLMKSSPFFKKYDFIDSKGYLGEGNHTICRRCVERRRGKEYAVKIVPIPFFREEEVNILNQLKNCYFITQIVEVIKDKSFVYIVMEPLLGGDLLQQMCVENKFRLKHAKEIIITVVAMVRLLHSNYVVHKNFRPEKLILETENECSSMRIVGFSNAQNTMDDCNLRSRFGQAADKLIAQRRKMLQSLDWWAVGLIVYIVIHGHGPSLDVLSSADQSIQLLKSSGDTMLINLDTILIGLMATNWHLRAFAWDCLVNSNWLSSDVLMESVQLSRTYLDFSEYRRIRFICDRYLGDGGILTSYFRPCPGSMITIASDVIKSPTGQKQASKKSSKRIPVKKNPPAPSTHAMKLRSSRHRPTDDKNICLL